MSLTVLVYVFFLGLMFTFLVPPFQKPDEIVHFNYALSLQSRSQMAEERYVNMYEKFKANKVAFREDVKFSVDNIFYKDGNRTKVKLSGYNNKLVNIVGFLPAVIGISIGKLFDYPIMAFWLARFFGLIFFLLSLVWSLHMVEERYKGIILVFASLPMVLHQVTSVNYDVMPLVLAPIMFAFFTRILVAENIRKLDLVGLLISVVLFMIAKAGYYFFAILLMVVIVKKYEVFFKKIWWLMLIPMVILVVFSIPAFYYLVRLFWSDGSGYVYPEAQFTLLRQDPFYLVGVLSNTFDQKWDFYLRTFMGYFGWLDYQYDLYSYLLVLGMLVYFIGDVVRRDSKRVVSGLNLLLLWLMNIGTVITFMMLFYFTWTNVGAEVVEGIVGRYMLVIFPFLFFAFEQTILFIGKSKSKVLCISILLFIIGFRTSKAIYARYYDFNGRFSNSEELVKKIDSQKKEGLKIEPVVLDIGRSFMMGVSPDDNIVGFSLYYDSRNIVSRVPYRYFIKDSECNKVKISGYLDQSKLSNDGVLSEKLKQFVPDDTALCVVLSPVIIEDAKEKYISIGKMDDEYLFNFLFQVKKQSY